MISQLHVRYMALVLLFTFCQVIGSMCAMPDLAEAYEAAFVEDRMACPMDGALMCPPSLTSSPERQIKNNLVAEVDHVLIPAGFRAIMAGRFIQARWSLDSAYSIVPISIESSSVLRI
ncbi:MAG: hypothetical protein HP494_03715 [Nitrospira sp.]|nr:hypothetical protein [Nitrospira sp.]MBH0194708.1 hypothetical protein [Nitrospira sp.]